MTYSKPRFPIVSTEISPPTINKKKSDSEQLEYVHGNLQEPKPSSSNVSMQNSLHRREKCSDSDQKIFEFGESQDPNKDSYKSLSLSELAFAMEIYGENFVPENLGKLSGEPLKSKNEENSR
jgi:hypothetical protein